MMLMTIHDNDVNANMTGGVCADEEIYGCVRKRVINIITELVIMI